MGRGRWNDRTPLLIGVITVGGAVALAAVSLVFPPTADADVLRTALILLGITTVAELVAIRVTHGESGELLTLFELAVVADIVLLPPAYAALVSVGGLALALLIQRRPLVKFAFNLGQYALGVVPAIALYHAVGENDFSTTAGLVSIAAGMVVFTLSNLLTISAIIAATTDQRMARVFGREAPISIAMGLGNAAVGMVAVTLWLTRPLLLPAVLAPAIALHLSFRGWVKQKEFSRLMEEETTKLSRILEHSSEGIVLASGDGTVLLWSPSMERITGISALEAKGKALPFLLRGQDVYGRAVSLDVSATTDPLELQVIAPDGTARWLRVQHGPGFDDRGRLSFDVLVAADITRQREVERLKDDFVSTVSHELRTPLTPIKGYATLLLRRMDEIPLERRREALQSIVDRSDHMARLVEDLLLASRIGDSSERRLPEVGRQAVDMANVARKAIRPFDSSNPLREFHLDASDGTVAMGDPLRIEQIIAHLVSNAVKFSEEGSPVHVSIEREGPSILIRVRDEGRGIPEKEHGTIFEKFTRLEDPMRMETGGAGLGLFIVKKLVDAMGGTITLDSAPAEGSTFSVALPAAPQGAAAEPGRSLMPRSFGDGGQASGA
ncbi:MAG TPA: ATP-binding protein [Actinomycetota bacterium]